MRDRIRVRHELLGIAETIRRVDTTRTRYGGIVGYGNRLDKLNYAMLAPGNQLLDSDRLGTLAIIHNHEALIRAQAIRPNTPTETARQWTIRIQGEQA